jgi:glycosyltransferase involved in cell wall biosynthesis
MNNPEMPRVSIIIPTHNRSLSLLRVLNALSVQTYPVSLLDIVVVADGCTDDTATILQRYGAAFSMRVLHQSKKGAGAARNFGAGSATGRLLIFIDDDVEPVPQFVAAHVVAHATEPNAVAVGYLPLGLDGRTDFFSIGARSWWENQFSAMRQPGYRFLYRNLFSGNFSLEADLFRKTGGFDCTLPRREDYEFGIRLMKADASFTFTAGALAYHHESSDVQGSLRRMFDEGQGDVLIGLKHPDVRSDLLLARLHEPKSKLDRLVQSLAFQHSRVGDTFASLVQYALAAAEKMRFRRIWRKLFIALRHYWYLRGAAHALGGGSALTSYFQGGSLDKTLHELEVELDLSEGLAAAEHLLDQHRPAGARIRYGGIFIGHLAARAGVERVRGVHLRPALLKHFASPLLQALILEQFRAVQGSDEGVSESTARD